MQPTSRRTNRVSVLTSKERSSETADNATSAGGNGGELGTTNDAHQMSEQTKMLYLDVSTGRAFPYVMKWMHDKANEMEAHTATIDETSKKVTMVSIDAGCKAINTARVNYDRSRKKLVTEVLMLRRVRDHQRGAGKVWLEAFRDAGNACIEEMEKLKAELNARVECIAEWSKEGGRARVLEKLAMLEDRHAILRNRSGRIAACEDLRRQQTLQRIREKMDKLVGEVSEAVMWDMHQQMHGSRLVCEGGSCDVAGAQTGGSHGGSTKRSKEDDVWLAETEDERVVRLEEARLSKELFSMQRKKFKKQQRQQQMRRKPLLADSKKVAEPGREALNDGHKDDEKPKTNTTNNDRSSLLPWVKESAAIATTFVQKTVGDSNNTVIHEDSGTVDTCSNSCPPLPYIRSDTRRSTTLSERETAIPVRADFENHSPTPHQSSSTGYRSTPPPWREACGKKPKETFLLQSQQRDCDESNIVSPSPISTKDTACWRGVVWPNNDAARQQDITENRAGSNKQPLSDKTAKLHSRLTGNSSCVVKHVGAAVRRPPIVLPPSISGSGLDERYSADHIAGLLSALSEDKEHFAASQMSIRDEVCLLQRKLREQRGETSRLFDINVALERQRAQLLAQREAQMVKLNSCREKRATDDETRNMDTEVLNDGLSCTLDLVNRAKKQRLKELELLREAIKVCKGEVEAHEHKMQIVREYWRRNYAALQYEDTLAPSQCDTFSTSSSRPDSCDPVIPNIQLPSSTLPYRTPHNWETRFSPQWTLSPKKSIFSQIVSSATTPVTLTDCTVVPGSGIPALGLHTGEAVSHFLRDLFDEISLEDVPELLFIGHPRHACPG
uniref:WGS project CAEQ00000000 data, annotated contig 1798 n=1 Tax=Trypanosoma congolense (strain IL3000) TaxID=1068625 RepID=F9W8Y2_TRYCI|nr:unnamed protein product [Trypanosoma congolense IL3000]